MDKYDSYIEKKKDLVHIAEHLQIMHQRLWEFSDSELALENAGGFYKHNPAVFIGQLNKAHPELASDDAFKKLKSLYDSLITTNLGRHYDLSSTLNSLNRLATQMANRTMNEETYNDILEGRIYCMMEAEEILQKPQEREYTERIGTAFIHLFQ